MINIKGLKVSLGGREVLKGVDLKVDAGETVALMGVSGSGKSTLMRAAVGLIRPDEGEVWLDGKSLAGMSAGKLREARKNVGMLFQGNALFDSMTVAENIGFVLREVMSLPLETAKPKVKELLKKLHLGPIGRKYPIELSGGMKKRVGIARALAHDPQMVFYDDPTAGLDPITSIVIAELIAELGQTTERAAIVVSNQMPVVVKVATRVVLLNRGKILDLGPPDGPDGGILESDRPELKEFLEYSSA